MAAARDSRGHDREGADPGNTRVTAILHHVPPEEYPESEPAPVPDRVSARLAPRSGLLYHSRPDRMPAMIDRLHEPPRAALRFRSDDLDEVRGFLDRHSGTHWRRVHGRGPLCFDAAVAAGPGPESRVGWFGGRLPQTVRGQAAGWVLHYPLEGAIAYRFGRQERRAVPGRGIAVAPHRDLTVVLSPGRVIAVQIGETSVAREMAARRLVADEHVPLIVTELSDETPHARNLHSALGQFLQEVCRAGPDSGATLALSHARLVGGLVDRLESRLSPVVASSVAAARLRRLEDWIDAHLHEPLTLGRLCEVAGVGSRSLQLAFEARRQATPMEYVMERRVAAAHVRLVAHRGASSVTEVATSVGIEHLGRFAARYRRLYGESPSATLRGGQQ